MMFPMFRMYPSPPDVGEAERAALLRPFDEGWNAPVGPDLAAFEAEAAAFTGSAGAGGRHPRTRSRS
jgi:pyridoxal phosphate-dependent aminotransferase EpsN